jgi:hypothetical protein
LWLSACWIPVVCMAASVNDFTGNGRRENAGGRGATATCKL